jgi:hypothetical protein
LHNSDSNGYPPRLHIANILLGKFENGQDVLCTYLAYICACVQNLREFNRNCKDWFANHVSENLQNDFWKDVEFRMNVIKPELMKKSTEFELTDEVGKYVKPEVTKQRDSTVGCLFEFDEAII